MDVLGSYGADSVRVETCDGREHILPMKWTSLAAPRKPATNGGKAVRLALEDLGALAKWVAARVGSVQGRKLDELDLAVDNVDPDGGAPRRRIGSAGGSDASEGERHRTAAAVVEQAGASSARRRSERRSPKRKRGTR